jgi:alcohol dehydrogenase YqhD (iron-dependent ADH family)
MKFEFKNPTYLVFGAGTLSQLGEVVRNHDKKALIVTGGGSIKRSDAFDCAIGCLQAAGVDVVECSGIEPDPRITSVTHGADIARNEGCDVVIALGGGSTVDGHP